MKIKELMEAKRVPTDKGYYTPGYDPERKQIVGTVKDWMARLGVTKDDLEAAIKQAKELSVYKDLRAVDVSTDAERANGTFSFKKPGATHEDVYTVYANGQIRTSAKTSWMNGERRPSRLKAPKPRLVAGDAVKSLVKIYDGAFKEVVSKMAERAKRLEKK
jgi:hypothetical protein